MLAALLIGFVFSFFASMPVAGPIAAIVVSKGLLNQRRAGLYIAIGAAFSEAIYAGMAFLGLTAMLVQYPVLVPASRLLGCVVLTSLGVYFIVRRPTATKDEKKGEEKQQTRASGFRNVFFGFSVTAVNPTLIATWTAAVSAAHGTGFLRMHALDALPFAGGVVAGIVSWFALLLGLLGHFQKTLQPTSLDRMMKAMGILLVIAGVVFGIRTIVTW